MKLVLNKLKVAPPSIYRYRNKQGLIFNRVHMLNEFMHFAGVLFSSATLQEFKALSREKKAKLMEILFHPLDKDHFRLFQKV